MTIVFSAYLHVISSQASDVIHNKWMCHSLSRHRHPFSDILSGYITSYFPIMVIIVRSAGAFIERIVSAIIFENGHTSMALSTWWKLGYTNHQQGFKGILGSPRDWNSRPLAAKFTSNFSNSHPRLRPHIYPKTAHKCQKLPLICTNYPQISITTSKCTKTIFGMQRPLPLLFKGGVRTYIVPLPITSNFKEKFVFF